MDGRDRAVLSNETVLSAIPAVLFAASFANTSLLSDRLHQILDRPEELPEMRLVLLEIREGHVVIGLELPKSIDLSDLPPIVENRFELAAGAITAASSTMRGIHLVVAHPGEPLAPPPVRSAPKPPRFSPSIAPDPSRFPLGQALRGKTIALSPGHGYIYYDTLGGYSTQRGRVAWNGCGDCRGIVEDFETHEIVIGHLVPLLEGAGAKVILVRERALSGAGSIADDGGAGFQELAGAFSAGSGGIVHGGGYRVSSSPDARAEWQIAAPRRGAQLLSAWFPSDPGRASDALLEVVGPFGTHRFVFDQRTHGQRWAPIGLFDLEENAPINVRLSAGTSGGEVAFDAVRLGSGTHSSNHPWWQMGAAPFAEYQNAPASVRTRGDVTIRPAYAEWYGADVYLSVHSNASGQANSTAAGTSTYRYNCGTYPDHSRDPAPADCDDPTGSDRLQALVHSAFIGALRSDWDANWRDRGTLVANFGELRELAGIPGILIETAFHDNVELPQGSTLRITDNQSLHDPRFRRIAAFALYRALSEFLVGAGPLLLPPPKAIAAKRIDATRVELTFDSIPDAGSYRVYVAQGRRTFDQGRTVSSSPAIIDGLAPELPAAFKIATINAAGEGLTSKIVAARPSARAAQILIVDGFDREDAWVQAVDNKGDTELVHGLALGGRQHAFDGATEAAWAQGLVDHSSYEGIVLALGRESSGDDLLTPTLRDAVAAHVARGGAVFASGSEIAWALDARGDETTRRFLRDAFGAAYASDDSGSRSFLPDPSGIYAALAGPIALDDGTEGALEARYSDVFTATTGGSAILLYGDRAQIAAVQKRRSVILGAALDSVVDPAAREGLIGAWADLIPIAPIEPGLDGGVADAAAPDAEAAKDANVALDAELALDSGSEDAAPGPLDANVSPANDAGARDIEPDPPQISGLIAAAEDPVKGGCGCSTSRQRRSTPALFALVWVAMLAARGSRGARSRCRDR
jgi:N-acetylmuramoyl-L-alanine amidase